MFWKKEELGMGGPRLRLGVYLEVLWICVFLPMAHVLPKYTSNCLCSKGEISSLKTKLLGTLNVCGN